jgi:ribosomal protein S18 acetylase RimI-like enzyme
METMYVLDNPVWQALSTTHESFAEGDDLVKRYPGAVSPLAGLREHSEKALASLGKIIAPGGVVALVSATPVAPPASGTVLRQVEIGQMIATDPLPVVADHKMERLDASRVPEMLALTELTKPGPFGTRTHELGTYLGIRSNGKLVAMAGTRLRLTGFSEISAVCTHPDFRARGFARSLVSALMLEMRERNEIPFLHVRMDNADAVHVYERLGFRLRKPMHLMILTSA